MAGYLVSVGKDVGSQAANVLSQYGEVGAISMELFAVRSDDDADTIRGKLAEAFPNASHILVASTNHCSYKGPGQVAFACRLINSEKNQTSVTPKL